MFCSTIIPTTNHPGLSQAVQSVLDQTFTADDFEVIVVNDSGQPLPEADWQKSKRVRIINTNRRERSFARNTGAAIARGRYLHFLDDDDWILSDALQHFWQLAQNSDAAWLYGKTRLLDLEGGQEVTLYLDLKGNCFVQAMTGEWIPLQASLIKTEAFFNVGGFNPLMTSAEDKNLCQNIALHNNLLCTPATVAVVTRRGKTTESYPRGWKLDRQQRENFLSQNGAFKRMHASANSSYWYGRLVCVYLISTIWNLRHKRVLTAVSRAAFSLIGFVLAGPHLFDPDFWRAITGRHLSRISKES